MKATVELKGTTPLLMHAFPLEPLANIEKKSKEEQAEYAAYRMDGKNLCIPSICLQRALISAANYSKGKGRSSLVRQTAACLFVSPESLDLGVKNYCIDSRPVVVPATKGRIIRHRPRLDEWSIRFKLEWDSELLTERQVRQIVDDCGLKVSLLDFRPERKGPFGKFIVTSWKTN